MPLFLQVATLVLALTAMLSILIGTLRTGITPMPSSKKATDAICSMLSHAPDGPLVELGSGWGGLAFALSRTRPKAPITGYELSTLPWLFSWLRTRVNRSKNVRFVRMDFQQADLSGAAGVICYLYPKGMYKVAQKLNTLAPGTVILCNTFALPGQEPLEVRQLKDM